MRRLVLLTIAALLLVPASAASASGGHGDDAHRSVRRQLEQVRRATYRFQNVRLAQRAGYVEFLDCFDSPDGGMGQHYVDLDALDGEVDHRHPEAMVYEVTPRGLRLVSVEYIVPSAFVDPADPPELFGQDFHLNAELDVWILHAWVWKHNPDGVFTDYNPRVRACPA